MWSPAPKFVVGFGVLACPTVSSPVLGDFEN